MPWSWSLQQQDFTIPAKKCWEFMTSATAWKEHQEMACSTCFLVMTTPSECTLATMHLDLLCVVYPDVLLHKKLLEF